MPTRDQAFAFLDALTGHVNICEGAGRPKSEHARTHLEAALGIGSLPWWDPIWRYRCGIASTDDKQRVNVVLDYLEGVVIAARGGQP
jgi:hypothetical protein